MLLDDFKRIITAFADSPADLDVSKGTLIVQVRDELIEAKLFQQGGQLIVDESEQRLPAWNWLVNRIARIPLLADRILSFVSDVPGFVTPSGRLLDQPDYAGTSEEVRYSDATACAADVLARRPAGTTSVLYLTSDAGEGKTTLINHLARRQASEFKAKRSDWLLVPIPLGGRTFLRFDDVVVAALVNRLRFQLLYYDAFIELVRLGVLVPAFDGFEEMIISSSSGEAISALGNLVRSLSSSGSVLIAARKAYFDYQSFKSQTRLFDAIGSDSVAFARLGLDRWSRNQFLSYAQNRGMEHAAVTYDAVADRLRADHPLLTRAVLVRRLIDVASTTGVSDLLDQVGTSPQDYFFQFVNALVDREAHEKWIDLSGEPHQPLLSLEEHHELLGMVAQEMWISSTDFLRTDVLGAIAEVFAEARHKPPAVARQLSERLKQHSLLISSGASAGSLAFDHEDFRAFYLGEAVGRILVRNATSDLKSVLQAGLLPRFAVDEAVLHTRRQSRGNAEHLAMLQDIAKTESTVSFVRENCGALSIGLCDGSSSETHLSGMIFPEDALRGRSLSRVVIRDSYFQTSSLAGTRLDACTFENCHFERLECAADTNVSSLLLGCDVSMLVRLDRDEQFFDPSQIRVQLTQVGFTVQGAEQENLPLNVAEPDDHLRLVERVLRVFLRANQVNEQVIRTKLGVKASQFIDEVLPRLLAAGVLEEIPYQGHGTQRRFRLRVRMEQLHEALVKCGGDFQVFVGLVSKP
jgi:hypothetical protein